MTSRTRDLPTASSLARVREIVAAIAKGHDRDRRAPGEAVGLSPRHADYYALAAIDTLRLARQDGERLVVTRLGRQLLATRAGSLAEREVLRRAIAESESVTSIAPDLVEADGPAPEALTRRMVHAGLAPATAARRASTLLSWRRYVLDRQVTIPVAEVTRRRARRSRR